MLKAILHAGEHSHSCNIHNTDLKSSLIWVVSAHTFLHALMHIVSLTPIILGITGIVHDHSVGELVASSILLNLIFHAGLSTLVIYAEKLRHK